MDKEKKEKKIHDLFRNTQHYLSHTIDELRAIIELCEDDKEDDRYDLLNDIKNRVTTARKRLKRIKLMDDNGVDTTIIRGVNKDKIQALLDEGWTEKDIKGMVEWCMQSDKKKGE
jgi:predicted DNA-binding ArsR family transcriptional regulator